MVQNMTMTRVPEAAPAWYPDPASGTELRYWDGQSWTERVSAPVVLPIAVLPRVKTLVDSYDLVLYPGEMVLSAVHTPDPAAMTSDLARGLWGRPRSRREDAARVESLSALTADEVGGADPSNVRYRLLDLARLTVQPTPLGGHVRVMLRDGRQRRYTWANDRVKVDVPQAFGRAALAARALPQAPWAAAARWLKLVIVSMAFVYGAAMLIVGNPTVAGGPTVNFHNTPTAAP